MEIGDKLICRKVDTADSGKAITTIGKEYTIINFGLYLIHKDLVEIRVDDRNVLYSLTNKLIDGNPSIHDFFITPKVARNKKLKTIINEYR